MSLQIDTKARPNEMDSRPSCFVISPIGEVGSPDRDAADKTLKHLIRKALDSDFKVDRGDADSNPGNITPRILAAIQEADVIVADLSGHNANVFYELAVAHGYAIPTVLIQRDGEKVPFDVKDMRTVRYDLSDPDKLEDAQKTLHKYAMYALANPGKLESPLSQAKRFEAVAKSDDPVTESNVQVTEALQDLSTEIRRVLDHTARAASLPFVDASTGTVQGGAGDISVLRRALSRVSSRGGLTLSDLDATISHRTTQPNDAFIRDLATKTPEFDGMNRDDVNNILLTLELLTQVRPEAPF